MSFSRSKRFDGNKDVTPGPGYYENGWGTIGSDSIKHKIHVTPRFLDSCRRIDSKRRQCIECTCVDFLTKKPSDDFLSITTPNFAVQNITFRGRNPNGTELRKMACNFILSRQKCSSHSGDSSLDEHFYQKVDNICENFAEDQLSLHSMSSSGEDSGFFSLSSSGDIKEDQFMTICLEKQSTYISDICKCDVSHQFAENEIKNRSTPKQNYSSSCRQQNLTPILKTKKSLIPKRVRFLDDTQSEEQLSTEKTNNSFSNESNDENDRNAANTEKSCSDEPKKKHDIMKLIERVFDGQSRLIDRRSDRNVRHTLIQKSLEFLEKKLISQKEDTKRILSLILIIQEEAMMLSSEENSLEKGKTLHLR